MSAQKLIEIAAAKGYSVGRDRPGLYRYGNEAMQRSGTEALFAGTWAEFVAHIKAL